MNRITISEFKATCLRLLEEVRQTGEPIEILKNGVPLAIVHPALPRSSKGAYGALKGSLREPAGDLLTPVDGVAWEALDDQRAKSQATP